MKQVYKTNLDGFYVTPVVLPNEDIIPKDCVEISPPNGLFKAKFENGHWIEGLSQLEIDAIKNTVVPLSDIDQLKKDQADLIFTLMMNGVL